MPCAASFWAGRSAMAAEADSWDADSFEPEPPLAGAPPLLPETGVAAADRWAGEDEDDDVKDNWDDDEEEDKEMEVKAEPKVSEKKKIVEKIKEKENQQKKKQEEIRKRIEALEESKDLTSEELLADKLRLQKLQEEADLELAKETFGVNTFGIDAMNPSSKDDFTEFGKLLKEKITQYEKSLHYAGFLETLVRDICISLEVDDLKRVTNSLTVLCSEKQKQEKQNKAKKKKKGVVPGGGLKATMKDDLEDYGGYDGGYVQDFEDFM